MTFNPPPHQRHLGHHTLMELYGCNPDTLRDVSGVENALRDAAEATRASVVHGNFHQFAPYGVSGFLLIEESHISIHTWPEHAYAAVDFFTCDSSLHIAQGITALQQAFESTNVHTKQVNRGCQKRLLPHRLRVV